MARTWTERTMIGGVYMSIKEAIEKHDHKVEAWGNNKEGWWPYLVDGNGIGLCIGPFFGREDGSTLRELKEAAGRAYGIDPKSVKLGRNWW